MFEYENFQLASFTTPLRVFCLSIGEVEQYSKYHINVRPTARRFQVQNREQYYTALIMTCLTAGSQTFRTPCSPGS